MADRRPDQEQTEALGRFVDTVDAPALPMVDEDAEDAARCRADFFRNLDGLCRDTDQGLRAWVQPLSAADARALPGISRKVYAASGIAEILQADFLARCDGIGDPLFGDNLRDRLHFALGMLLGSAIDGLSAIGEHVEERRRGEHA